MGALMLAALLPWAPHAAFSGLRVDIDRVRADNAAKTDAKRKSGLIIWSGGVCAAAAAAAAGVGSSSRALWDTVLATLAVACLAQR